MLGGSLNTVRSRDVPLPTLQESGDNHYDL